MIDSKRVLEADGSLEAAVDFDEQLRNVVLPVRAAVTQVLQHVGGHSPHVRDVCGALGVYVRLGWQLAKVSCEAEPRVVARHIPAPGGIRSFLAAASKRGVPAALIRAVEDSTRRFEAFVERHADNREFLDLMLSTDGEAANETAIIAARRSAFVSSAALFGVHARALLNGAIIHPAEPQGSTADVLRYRGWIGLRRNRSSATWIIGATRAVRGPGESSEAHPPDAIIEGESLDPARDEAGFLNLLRPFSAGPTPVIERRRQADGRILDRLVEGEVGNVNAMTFFSAELMRQCLPIRAPEPERAEFVTRITTPMEALIFDILIHESLLSPPPAWKAQLLTAFEPLSVQGAAIEMPLLERVESRGVGLDALAAPEIPLYASVIETITSAVKWSASEFSVHRFRMKFPLMSTQVLLSYPVK